MEEHKQQEKIQLGFWSAVLFGINLIIGSGIFLLPGTLMKDFGPAIIIVYLVDGLLVLLIAFCFAECAGLFDQMGGAYVYAKEAFGNFVGFVVGIVQLFVALVTQAAMIVGLAMVIVGFFPKINNSFGTMLVSTAIGILLLLLNFAGNKTTTLFGNIITIGKMLPILLIIIVGVVTFNIDNFHPFFIAKLTNPTNFSSAALLLFFAFGGFESVAVISEEMKNPKKNLPKALIIIVATVVVTYLLVQVAAISILGNNLVNTSVPLQTAVGEILGNFGSVLVAVGTIVSMIGVVIAMSYALPRIAMGLSEQKMLPQKFAKVDRRGVPKFAIVVTTINTLLIAYSGTFSTLAEMSAILTFAQYIPTCAAVLVFHQRKLQNEESFTVPFGPAIPILAIIMSIWLLATANPIELIESAIVILIAIVIYFLMKIGKKENEKI